jgi:hypothetical protein
VLSPTVSLGELSEALPGDVPRSTKPLSAARKIPRVQVLFFQIESERSAQNIEYAHMCALVQVCVCVCVWVCSFVHVHVYACKNV